MPYRAVLFDLDGTLLDTLQDLAEATNQCLARRHLSIHPIASYRNFVGDGARKLIERVVPASESSPDLIDLLLQEFLQEYGRNWAVKTCPYPGIDALLSRLAAQDLPMTILSNKPDAYMNQIVEHFFPHHHFAEIRGLREDTPRKPDPAGALAIAQSLQIPAADFVYLGDTATDMQTATSAGMLAIGVLWGFREAEELRQAGAHNLIHQPTDLFSILKDK